MEPAAYYRKDRPAYRLELLPTVLPYFRRARTGQVAVGDPVYYGPMPTYYGIGEVKHPIDTAHHLYFTLALN